MVRIVEVGVKGHHDLGPVVVGETVLEHISDAAFRNPLSVRQFREWPLAATGIPRTHYT